MAGNKMVEEDDHGLVNVHDEPEDFYYFRQDRRKSHVLEMEMLERLSDRPASVAIFKEKGSGGRMQKSPTGKKKKIFVQPPMWARNIGPRFYTIYEKVPASYSFTSSARTSANKPETVQLILKLTRKLSIADETLDDTKFMKKLKQKSVAYNNAKKYKRLSEIYSVAIEKFPENADFYCNRSYAFFMLEYYGMSVDDANNALRIDEDYARAYYRRALGYVAIGKWLNAIEDFEYLTKKYPKSAKMNCLQKYCQKAMNRSLFNVVLNENVSHHEIHDLFNPNKIKVGKKYVGPRSRYNRFNPAFLWDLIRHFKCHAKLHRKFTYKILLESLALLKSMPTLVEIDLIAEDDRITICGDIQGQVLDLISILEKNGFPSAKHRYLFNGNIIGRGSCGVESVLLVLAVKLVYPLRCFIARGHYECDAMSQIYGFEREVKEKYSPVMYELFIEVFKWLPIAHCINNRILVLHGGLSREDNITLDNINEIERNVEPVEVGGLISDLIWSDPKDSVGVELNYRGFAGVLFGPDVTFDFVERNQLDYIIRSHEYKENGYAEEHAGKCITVFSAPNYYSRYTNKGCIISIQGRKLVKSEIFFEVNFLEPATPLQYADSIMSLIF